MSLLGNRNGGSPVSAGEPPSPDERISVELGAEVLVRQRRHVVMRGHAGNRRLLVIADPRMSRAKIAAELRQLADRVIEEL